MQTDPTATAPRFLGKYEVLARLDSGGMAEIFLARTHGIAGFEKMVVLKRILPHLAAEEEFVSLFLDEAKTTVALSHGNVVQVFDMGRGEDGDYFIAMEYVAGKNLRRFFRRWMERRNVPLDPSLAIWIAAEALRGLDYAHRRSDGTGRPLGIVHRDLSPHNILVSYDGEVKVADFGIAKAAGKVVRTETGLIRGKASYMSPEQASGDTLDGRSDLFAVGINLYEMLTGNPPYYGEQPQRILEDLTRGPLPAPPSAKRAGIPPGLDAVVMRALARDRENRFPTADLFLRELGTCLVSSGTVVGPRDLSACMDELFAEEIRQERAQISALPRGSDPASGGVPTLHLGGGAGEISRSGAVIAVDGDVGSKASVRAGRRRTLWRGAVLGAVLVFLPVAGYFFAQGRANQPDQADPGSAPSPPSPAGTAVTAAVAGGPTASPAPSPSAIRTRSTPRVVAVTATPVPKMGMLSITADPYAYIHIDGKPLVVEPGHRHNFSFEGQELTITPIQAFKVSPGRHKIEAFELREGKLVKAAEEIVDVRAGPEPLLVRFNLQPAE